VVLQCRVKEAGLRKVMGAGFDREGKGKGKTPLQPLEGRGGKKKRKVFVLFLQEKPQGKCEPGREEVVNRTLET